MNREEIKNILPHREPMLLIDEADISAEEAYGRYTVRGDEFFLDGHFPGNPVVPGVILCEMMGQASCLLVGEMVEGFTPYFTGMNNVKFKRMVMPGDTIEFRGIMTRKMKPFYFIKCAGRVGGEVAVEGELSFAVLRNRED